MGIISKLFGRKPVAVVEPTPEPVKLEPIAPPEPPKRVVAVTHRQLAVIGVINGLGGAATDRAIVEDYLKHDKLPQQSPSGIRTRRVELLKLGVVFESADKVRAKNGKYAARWGVRQDILLQAKPIKKRELAAA